MGTELMRYSISQGLRELRARKGWTNTQLGIALGTCRDRACNLCSQRELLAAPAIRKFAARLGVEAGWLAGAELPSAPVKTKVMKAVGLPMHCTTLPSPEVQARNRAHLLQFLAGENGEYGDYLAGNGPSVFLERHCYGMTELTSRNGGRQITAKHSGG